MINWSGVIIKTLIVVIMVQTIIFTAKKDTKNDNRINPPTISNNNGLRGASRCGENNF